MYTKPGLELGSFAGFDFASLLTKAQTAVQKIQATAQKVKTSASQFLPPEAVQTIQAAPPVPISAAAASATPLMPSGLPIIPLILAGGAAAFFILRRRKK